MAPSATLILFFQLVMLAGTAVTGMRMFSFGLHRKYQVFFAYLIFWTLGNGISLCLPVKSQYYFYFWIINEPLVWIFNVLMVLELYSLVLEKHKGLYTVGRWALYGTMSVSVLLSSLSLIPRTGAPQRTILSIYYVVERGLDFSMVIFLLILVLILARYPIVLSRNVILHTSLFSALFLSNTLGLLFHSVVGKSVSRPVSVVLMGVSALCVLLWMLFFDSRGEKALFRLPYIGAEQEGRLVSQLETLNTTLVRASRN